MEYNSNTRQLTTSCDDYSSLLVRHANCTVECYIPLDGWPCPCVFADRVEDAETTCIFNGVTTHHASRSVLMERGWCRDNRQGSHLRFSDFSDLPVSVVFTD